jgi:hypothetical protein
MLLATNDSVKVDIDVDDDMESEDDVEIDDDVNDDNLDTDHGDDASLCFCSINDILGSTGSTPRALVAEEMHVMSSDEPASFVEA